MSINKEANCILSKQENNIMNNKYYINYSAEQLLQDPFFMESQLHPTEESKLFWEQLSAENSLLAKEIQHANTLLKSIPYRNRLISTSKKKELWNRIKATNQQNKRRRIKQYLYTSIAASFALLFTIGGFYYFDLPENKQLTNIESVMKPTSNTDQIQLILGDKKGLNINDESSKLQYNKKGKLSINTEEKQKQIDQEEAETGYNQLIVPSAKRSFIELSDGTKVWVNANTRVVYPITFNQQTREIYVEGEVYLEVHPDKVHPFIVKTKSVNVSVLGTSFNVSAHETELETSVVLVTGKVNVAIDNKEAVTLQPSQMFSYNNGKAKVKVVDVEEYISWKEGVYNFDNEYFSFILHKLSTYYGKKFIASPQAATLRCSGTLSLQDDLTKVLNGLENTVPVSFNYESESIKVDVKP